MNDTEDEMVPLNIIEPNPTCSYCHGAGLVPFDNGDGRGLFYQCPCSRVFFRAFSEIPDATSPHPMDTLPKNAGLLMFDDAGV